jgi:hypothetical protein
MADPETPSGANGTAEARKSLRDIAEDAYDEVLDAAESDSDDASPAEPAGQDGQPRDKYGRFAPRGDETAGEAEVRTELPAPPDEPKVAPDATVEAHPAPEPGSSNRPPEHWSPEARALFARQPDEVKAFILDRHHAMERDYQEKVQASATAVKFTEAVAPIFNDPVLAGSMQTTGTSPVAAIHDWARLHRLALDPDPRVRLGVVGEIAQRMGFDPAALFGPPSPSPVPGLSEQEAADPAIKYFADHLGRIDKELQAQKVASEQRAQRELYEQQARDNQLLQMTRAQVDQFADEKDAQGRPLRPDFNLVLPQVLELYAANPERNLAEAYATARWMNEESRKGMLAAQTANANKALGVEKAKAASRGNLRGMTTAVTRPPGEQAPKSLRDVLNDAADEVGF